MIGTKGSNLLRQGGLILQFRIVEDGMVARLVCVHRNH